MKTHRKKMRENTSMINDKSFLDEDLLIFFKTLFTKLCFESHKECCYAIKADDSGRRRNSVKTFLCSLSRKPLAVGKACVCCYIAVGSDYGIVHNGADDEMKNVN